MVAALAKLSAMKGRSWSEQKLCPVDPLSNPKVGGWAMGSHLVSSQQLLTQRAHLVSSQQRALPAENRLVACGALALAREGSVTRVLALTAA